LWGYVIPTVQGGNPMTVNGDTITKSRVTPTGTRLFYCLRFNPDPSRANAVFCFFGRFSFSALVFLVLHGFSVLVR